MSETSAARPILAKFCNGVGLDIGFGGSAIVPNAITFDMPKGYCKSFEGHPQILRGNCKDLSFICDNCLDYIYSSHLLEDFTYNELLKIVPEWKRVLKVGGLLVINCPDQQKFLAHCRKTGQPVNNAHKEQDFSFDNFYNKVITKIKGWEKVFEDANVREYCWYLVLKKTS